MISVKLKVSSGNMLTVLRTRRWMWWEEEEWINRWGTELLGRLFSGTAVNFGLEAGWRKCYFRSIVPSSCRGQRSEEETKWKQRRRSDRDEIRDETIVSEKLLMINVDEEEIDQIISVLVKMCVISYLEYRGSSSLTKTITSCLLFKI